MSNAAGYGKAIAKPFKVRQGREIDISFVSHIPNVAVVTTVVYL